VSRSTISCICLTSWPKRSTMLMESLRAYALQKHSPRRLLLINDGDPLKTLARDVCVVNLQEKVTIGVKRNYGLEFAADSWASTWDDDDFMFPEHLPFLLQKAMAKKLDHIQSGIYAAANSNMEIGCVMHRPALGASILWAPRAMSLGGYPNTSSGEDGIMYATILKTKTPSDIHRRLTYVYRRHQKNTTCQYAFGNREDRRLTECLEDQKHWPSTEVEDLQTYLDYCRKTETPALVQPI
jgi:glycosyltransferase involved in cell wall biosynthesis